MKSATKLALVIGTTGLVLTAGSLNAFATWTAAAPTSAMKVTAAELPRGETPTISASGTDVLVRWEPSVLSDGTEVRKYTVTRWRAGRWVVVCAGVSATNCTDENVAEGSWTWRVRPSIGDWEGTDSADSEPLVVLRSKDAVRVAGTSPPATTARRTDVGGKGGEAPPPAATTVVEPAEPAADRPATAPSAALPPPEEINVSEPAPPTVTPAAEDDKQ